MKPVQPVSIKLPSLQDQKNIQVKTSPADIQAPSAAYAAYLSVDLENDMDTGVKGELSKKFHKQSTLRLKPN